MAGGPAAPGMIISVPVGIVMIGSARPVEITPSQFHCHDHQQQDLTELVKEELELRTPAAFPVRGSKVFRVIVTCPGAGTAHDVTCSGTVTA